MVTSPQKTVTTMSDKAISELFQDVYNKFWQKWRGNVPERDSDDIWSEIVKEAGEIMDKYEHRADPVVLFIMDRLDERSKTHGE